MPFGCIHNIFPQSRFELKILLKKRSRLIVVYIHVSTKMTRSLNELMFYGLLICYKQRELALLVIITESYNIDIYMYMEFDVTWTRPKQNTLSIDFNMTTFVFLF